MLHLVDELMNSDKRLFGILEDDVLLHVNFTSLWNTIQSTPRCSSFLQSRGGGVLLLGASEWTRDAWDVLKRSPHEKICYNAFQRSSGTFAYIVSRPVLPFIKRWIMSSSRPLDHMYEYLMQQGIPVRVANPNLMIADIEKTSDVDSKRTLLTYQQRYYRMRWDRTLYA